MKFWSELRRRNVLRMAALYLVAAWLLLQVTEVLSGLIDLPDWLGPLVLAMLVTGLPVALIISWFFEITGSGIARDSSDVKDSPTSGLSGRRLDFVIISMLAAAVLVFAWLTWWPESPAEKSIAVLAFRDPGAARHLSFLVVFLQGQEYRPAQYRQGTRCRTHTGGFSPQIWKPGADFGAAD
jgi:hypothetical protein